ncbi:MAG: hypothetical protein AB7R55_03865 [Gemmatimonadales bacterium]
MPVTAKLSKLFYDRLGEQIATELVDWFNAVDATYRADLRELNELNFARFDAKLEQRIAELRSELARLEARLGAEIARLEARIDERAATLLETVERRFTAQGRWLLAGWASLLATMIGLLATSIWMGRQ